MSMLQQRAGISSFWLPGRHGKGDKKKEVIGRMYHPVLLTLIGKLKATADIADPEITPPTVFAQAILSLLPLQTSGGRRETAPIHLMFHLKMVRQRFIMVSLAYRGPGLS
ncbi:uncharacterized protein BBA_06065 [Beauveria bassiana ARSEF 2860]|uniref:Uncharacterized protein n=1 Tax=Beauveria bassiana (strain ARSEF 2860) TaxID=655819 RepID=J4W387_BEAB2|nr:uncharacterized protein BBA_06065 [Beauveria bassiana ARSEF 2860]EJP64890.1 hypothetical protein BBA_06065 [Beauveria bassiana ARSEF 2860]